MGTLGEKAVWVDGKLCSYVEIFGCQRHTASLSIGNLKPNGDRGVNLEKFTSAVVVPNTRRPVRICLAIAVQRLRVSSQLHPIL